MAVAAILEGTNVDKKFVVPKHDGNKATVHAIEEVMRDDGENVGKTVYLVGGDVENMGKSTLPIRHD